MQALIFVQGIVTVECFIKRTFDEAGGLDASTVNLILCLVSWKLWHRSTFASVWAELIIFVTKRFFLSKPTTNNPGENAVDRRSV